MRALGIAFLAVACARKRPSHHGEDLAQWVRSHEVGPPRDAALEETMQRARRRRSQLFAREEEDTDSYTHRLADTICTPEA